MNQNKFTETKNVVGVYCILMRDTKRCQRWAVTFEGIVIARFRRRTTAAQFAAHYVRVAMRDMVALENKR